VAAIGKLDEFPPDSYHAQTLDSNVDANGYFSAKFSCFGPQVAVCAPGVAITSCVPPNNFAAWDGTSMATPHVTGLAALVLAHHPDFQALYKTRGPDRVERLFQIIKSSARRVSLGDQSRTGYGLPDVLAAVGLQAQAGQPVAQSLAPQSLMGAAFPQPAYANGNGGALDPFSLDAARAAYVAFVPWYAQQLGQLPGTQFGPAYGRGGW